MADTFAIRPAGEHEFTAFATVWERAFSSAWPTEPLIEHERITFELDRSLAAFDGPAPVGTTAAYTFELTVPGGTAAAAGITAVAVLPEYRRRGVLTALMARQLADIRDRGEPVAMLFASESGIYGRFGYGCAAEQLSLSFRRGDGRQLPAALGAGTAGIRLEAAEPAQAKAELAAVYDAVRPGRPGMYARDERWWTAEVDDPEIFREGSTPLRAVLAMSASGPRGYALYSVKPGHSPHGLPGSVLTVQELMCAGPDAAAALWRDLLSRDLISAVSVPNRPVDDAVLYLLADRREARPELEDGLYVRIVDVPGALTARRYPAEVDIVIEVADDQIGENCGRWRLESGGLGDPAPARCARTSDPADVWLPARVLGAAYLGGGRLSAYAAAGQLAELRPGALARLTAALGWDVAPWCPAVF